VGNAGKGPEIAPDQDFLFFLGLGKRPGAAKGGPIFRAGDSSIWRGRPRAAKDGLGIERPFQVWWPGDGGTEKGRKVLRAPTIPGWSPKARFGFGSHIKLAGVRNRFKKKGPALLEGLPGRPKKSHVGLIFRGENTGTSFFGLLIQN